MLWKEFLLVGRGRRRGNLGPPPRGKLSGFRDRGGTDKFCPVRSAVLCPKPKISQISKNLKWNRYQITEAYMVMGGIPYYLNGIKKGKSAAQCIDEMCFDEAGLLYDEFGNLYASLFRNSANYIAVVEALSRKAMGLTREQIVAAAKLANGGGLSKVLEELEESGFIRKYLPFKNKLKHSVYQLTDFYS